MQHQVRGRADVTLLGEFIDPAEAFSRGARRDGRPGVPGRRLMRAVGGRHFGRAVVSPAAVPASGHPLPPARMNVLRPYSKNPG
jgi:hypothetical protein